MPESSSRALIVGCGDIAMASARLIGRRHPLVLTDIDQSRLDLALAAVTDEGYEAEGYRLDISDGAEVAGLARYVRGGAPLRVIAHVAALGPSVGDWRKVLTVNLAAPHLISQHLGPLIESGGVGVFVGSVAGYFDILEESLFQVLDDPLTPDFLDRVERVSTQPMTGYSAYAYAKAGLQRLAEILSVSWGKRNVRALSVSPGLVLSEMGARERKHNPSTGDYSKITPLGREASVAEIAAVIDFAASDKASFLTGIDILADGGLRAQWRAKQRRGEATRHIR